MALTAEQLRRRQFRIGGSEIATIFGYNPYCTPYELWARKTGRLDQDTEGTVATELGDLIEPLLLSWIEKKYNTQLVRGEEFQAEGFPVVCTLDARWADRSKVVEAKTGGLAHYSRDIAKHWDGGECPEWYWWQLQTQMFAAKIPAGMIIALIGGKGLLEYEAELDAEYMAEALARATDWWDAHVAMDVEPVAFPEDADIIRKVRPNYGEEIELPEEACHEVDQLQELKEQASSIDAEIELLKGQLILRMGLATEGLLPDGRLLKLREVKKKQYVVQAQHYRELRLPKKPKTKP